MKNDEQLLRELEQASAGLLFMSESDYPFELVHWKGLPEVTPQYLNNLTGQPAPSTIESVEDFFRVAASEQAWHGEAERETARKYQALVRLLKENLNQVKVYKVGKINIAVYIVGQSGEGNWLGLSTRVVET